MVPNGHNEPSSQAAANKEPQKEQPKTQNHQRLEEKRTTSTSSDAKPSTNPHAPPHSIMASDDLMTSHPSLISRIQHSASGLASNAVFASAGATDLAHGLSRSTGNKAGAETPSSSSGSTWHTETHLGSSSPSSSSSSSLDPQSHSQDLLLPGPGAAAGGFRENSSRDGERRTGIHEAEGETTTATTVRYHGVPNIALASIDTFSQSYGDDLLAPNVGSHTGLREEYYQIPSSGLGTYDLSVTNSDMDIIPEERLDSDAGGVGRGKGKARDRDPVVSEAHFHEAWERSGAEHSTPSLAVPQSGLHRPSTTTCPSPAAQPAAATLSTDGAAIIALLSDTSFDPKFTAEDDNNDNIQSMLEEPPPLSPAEIQIIESFRRADSDPDSGPLPSSLSDAPTTAHRITSVSLIPDIGSVLHDVRESGVDSAAVLGLSNMRRLREEVLDRLPGAADWIAVEERYHDEVWGYLRPVLRAAAEEIEEGKSNGKGNDGQDGDGPAVRRLKFIFGHMRARL